MRIEFKKERLPTLGMASLSPTIALIRSAFGPTATLYDALSSSKDVCQADLKKAYRKLALKYHPDKQVHFSSSNDSSIIKEATAKFQAVSAAYEVLMDEKRRAIYDATGRVEDYDDDDAHNPTTSSCGRDKHKSASEDQRQHRWDDFFRSVFNDIMTADSKHGNADTYQKSSQEKDDVLKFYSMCKGDLKMVLNCVVHGTEKDIDRWKMDIILPAIERGDIKDYCDIADVSNNKIQLDESPKRNAKLNDLVDSDEDDDDQPLTGKRTKNKTGDVIKMKKLKGNRERTTKLKPKATATVLIDSDDDVEDDYSSRFNKASSLPMNRRDKMEYRVAKKRKLKAKREIEIANIIKSKSWTSGEAVKKSMNVSNQLNRSGAITNEMLSNMEKKYSKGAGSGIRKKIRRKK